MSLNDEQLDHLIDRARRTHQEATAPPSLHRAVIDGLATTGRRYRPWYLALPVAALAVVAVLLVQRPAPEPAATYPGLGAASRALPERPATSVPAMISIRPAAMPSVSWPGIPSSIDEPKPDPAETTGRHHNQLMENVS